MITSAPFALMRFIMPSNGRLAEVVGVRLHGRAVDTDYTVGGFRAILIVAGIVVPACFAQYSIGNVVLARAVRFHDGRHHVLRNVPVVGQELFGIFGEAVAAVAEGGIVVVGADTGVETDAFDDGTAVETFDFGIGVEFVEVADAEGKVGVGKEFHGFSFLHAHKEGVDVFLDGSFLQEGGKGLGGCLQHCYIGDGFDGCIFGLEFGQVDDFGITYNDTAGVKVVVKGLTLAKEFGGEKEVEFFDTFLRVLQVEVAGVAYGDGALDNHHGIGIDFEYKVDYFFHMAGVEVVLHRVVVSGSGNDYKVGFGVGCSAIEGSHEVQRLFGQIFFDVIVPESGKSYC